MRGEGCEVNIEGVMSGSDRHIDAATSAAVSASVALTGTVRLLAALSVVPLVATDPAALTGLGGTAAVAAAELAAAPLLAADRRWWPVALAGDLVAAGIVLLVAGPGWVVLLHSVGTAALAAALLGVSGVVAALALGLGVAVLTAWLPAGRPPLPVTAVAALPGPYALAAVVVAVVRHLLATEVALREGLRAATERAARAEERGRLARDLHDSTAATLAGIRLSVTALHARLTSLATTGGPPARQLGPPDAAGPDAALQDPARSLELAVAIAGEVAAAADRALFEARVVVADLRREDPEDPLEDAVRRTAMAWRGAAGRSVAVELAVGPVPEPAPDLRAALLGALREALLNVDRHAGAGQVRVALAAAGGTVRLTVTDDGRGFPVPPDLGALTARGHYGLAGMAERARDAGGRVDLATGPAGGAAVRVELPLTAAALPAATR